MKKSTIRQRRYKDRQAEIGLYRHEMYLSSDEWKKIQLYLIELRR